MGLEGQAISGYKIGIASVENIYEIAEQLTKQILRRCDESEKEKALQNPLTLFDRILGVSLEDPENPTLRLFALKGLYAVVDRKCVRQILERDETKTIKNKSPSILEIVVKELAKTHISRLGCEQRLRKFTDPKEVVPSYLTNCILEALPDFEGKKEEKVEYCRRVLLAKNEDTNETFLEKTLRKTPPSQNYFDLPGPGDRSELNHILPCLSNPSSSKLIESARAVLEKPCPPGMFSNTDSKETAKVKHERNVYYVVKIAEDRFSILKREQRLYPKIDGSEAKTKIFKVRPISAVPGSDALILKINTKKTTSREKSQSCARLSHAKLIWEEDQVGLKLREKAKVFTGFIASEALLKVESSTEKKHKYGVLMRYAESDLKNLNVSDFTLEKRLDIIEALMSALLHFHLAGFVHGDIKPANCLYKNGTAFLADFGGASLSESVDPDHPIPMHTEIFMSASDSACLTEIKKKKEEDGLYLRKIKAVAWRESYDSYCLALTLLESVFECFDILEQEESTSSSESDSSNESPPRIKSSSSDSPNEGELEARSSWRKRKIKSLREEISYNEPKLLPYFEIVAAMGSEEIENRLPLWDAFKKFEHLRRGDLNCKATDDKPKEVFSCSLLPPAIEAESFLEEVKALLRTIDRLELNAIANADPTAIKNFYTLMSNTFHLRGKNLSEDDLLIKALEVSSEIPTNETNLRQSPQKALLLHKS